MEVFRFSIISTEEFEKREGFRKAINCCPQCDHAMEFHTNKISNLPFYKKKRTAPSVCTNLKPVAIG